MTLLSKGRNGWTGAHLLACFGLVAVGIAVTAHAWVDITRIALRDEESSHIFLVPIIAAWLVWVRRARFRYCRPGPSIVGPIFIATGWLFSWIGYNHAVQSFWHGGTVLVTIGCFLTVAGHEVFLRFLPAFMVLIFLIPIPGMARQQVSIPLQTATAGVTQFLFDFFGFEIERTGNVLRINGIDVAIAEACNGMRMVLALVLVSFAFAFGTPLRHYARLLVLIVSPVSAIACNVIRLLPTVWMYGYYPMPMATRFHDITGWVMLPIAFLLLMAVIRLLRWAMIPVTQYTLAYD